VRIDDPKRPWIPASTHSDPQLFRKRMEQYRKQEQAKGQPTAKVQPIKGPNARTS
jgi:hypothetical protein